jgi:hypothetical protein
LANLSTLPIYTGHEKQNQIPEMIEMREAYTVAITAILCMGLLFSAESMAGVVNAPPELVLPDQKLDRLQYLTLQDAVSGTTDFYGNTPVPEYQP